MFIFCPISASSMNKSLPVIVPLTEHIAASSSMISNSVISHRKIADWALSSHPEPKRKTQNRPLGLSHRKSIGRRGEGHILKWLFLSQSFPSENVLLVAAIFGPSLPFLSRAFLRSLVCPVTSSLTRTSVPTHLQ